MQLPSLACCDIFGRAAVVPLAHWQPSMLLGCYSRCAARKCQHISNTPLRTFSRMRFGSRDSEDVYHGSAVHASKPPRLTRERKMAVCMYNKVVAKTKPLLHSLTVTSSTCTSHVYRVTLTATQLNASATSWHLADQQNAAADHRAE